MAKWFLGVIGGSGLYEIEGLTGEWRTIDTPFGKPSDDIFVGELEGQKIAFLPRHGRGHKYSPSSINYRANIYALKSIGVTDILSVSAVGSLKQKYEPGHFVFVDQFIDTTYKREKSFFGDGLVAHVSMAHPTCPRLSKMAQLCAKEVGATIHKSGTYLVMEGPQFSSKAESELYRSWNCDVIGMTNMPEAKLAREAQMPYATIAMVTDYDCWNEEHDHVDVQAVIRVLNENSERAKQTIRTMVHLMRANSRGDSPIDRALRDAIITAPAARDPEMVKKLAILMK